LKAIAVEVPWLRHQLPIVGDETPEKLRSTHHLRSEGLCEGLKLWNLKQTSQSTEDGISLEALEERILRRLLVITAEALEDGGVLTVAGPDS